MTTKLVPLPFAGGATKPAFSVVQLNILASNLASPSHFPYVQPAVLAWETRKNILLDQLHGLDADVVCLEECSDYWTFFRPAMARLGYESAWVKRPSTHRSTWSGEKKMDGCGIFFRNDRYELRECESFNFHDEHDRVALLVLLQERSDDNKGDMLLVGCTHLWWNSRKVDHQMKQLRELDNEVRALKTSLELKYQHLLHAPLPVVLCGDFNNSPSSPLYAYMRDVFLQPLAKMRSAYASYRTLPETPDAPDDDCNEPPHTTVNYRRCWAIDYIWYSEETIKAQAILPIPTEAELREEDGPDGWHAIAQVDPTLRNYNGIPNSKHGSDHVPIMAQFTLR
ncbi:hypothetical protein SPRG_19107 [Saprolegnia parasitica CBS 223.65]|uniref:Endonuclease/exonuclease/phosphatase domain-containing protein n=1 Tax=Saprolegnia parasitica (strain CBS 223.65) TaxID=695850 RepID=A0A067CUC4_SAPPC|nr:hypothetical protein SPRG_19107 [Saprolegnia parasitica CBS 223.65]KDO34289.1 hypothetical protein SPRG_19107 [Saprolegnia parasitica CBS 223.65]|eukprot:XP_012195300.1 hypothetical protein SPRG_19107 [Saprolegnia parasitica CBS 223.65]